MLLEKVADAEGGAATYYVLIRGFAKGSHENLRRDEPATFQLLADKYLASTGRVSRRRERWEQSAGCRASDPILREAHNRPKGLPFATSSLPSASGLSGLVLGNTLSYSARQCQHAMADQNRLDANCPVGNLFHIRCKVGDGIFEFGAILALLLGQRLEILAVLPGYRLEILAVLPGLGLDFGTNCTDFGTNRTDSSGDERRQRNRYGYTCGHETQRLPGHALILATRDSKATLSRGFTQRLRKSKGPPDQ